MFLLSVRMFIFYRLALVIVFHKQCKPLCPPHPTAFSHVRLIEGRKAQTMMLLCLLLAHLEKQSNWRSSRLVEDPGLIESPPWLRSTLNILI